MLSRFRNNKKKDAENNSLLLQNRINENKKNKFLFKKNQ